MGELQQQEEPRLINPMQTHGSTELDCMHTQGTPKPSIQTHETICIPGRSRRHERGHALAL